MGTDQDKFAQPTPKADEHVPSPADESIGLIAMGLGRFRVMSEHEHRLEWERKYRRG